MLKQALLTALTIAVISLKISAQTFPFYHYTPREGLASSTVYQIIQSRDGYIWFATMNGISRFDGKRFTTYRTQDGLNSNSIISKTQFIQPVEPENIELHILQASINDIEQNIIKPFHES